MPRLKAIFPILPPHVRLSYPPAAVRPSGPSAVSFFRDPGHTIPTKWALYRPLLKLASGYTAIKTDVKDSWRRKKGWTSVPRVREFLEKQYDLLGKLQSITSDITQVGLATLESRLTVRQQISNETLQTTAEEQAENDVSSPRLTGGYHRPTLFNPPLPRMKPQSESISMMIHNRLRARERRMEKRRRYAGFVTDMKLEQSFWREMEGSSNSDWSRNKDPRSPGGWDKVLRDEMIEMDVRFSKENRRADAKYTEDMMNRVGRAKERRNAWRKQQAQAKSGETSSFSAD